jgi:hypothetical protein
MKARLNYTEDEGNSPACGYSMDLSVGGKEALVYRREMRFAS